MRKIIAALALVFAILSISPTKPASAGGSAPPPPKAGLVYIDSNSAFLLADIPNVSLLPTVVEKLSNGNLQYVAAVWNGVEYFYDCTSGATIYLIDFDGGGATNVQFSYFNATFAVQGIYGSGTLYNATYPALQTAVISSLGSTDDYTVNPGGSTGNSLFTIRN